MGLFMLTKKEQEVLNEINHKNILRYDIKRKKRILAKMVSSPELLEETLVLKSEIETLELELELTMK